MRVRVRVRARVRARDRARVRVLTLTLTLTLTWMPGWSQNSSRPHSLSLLSACCRHMYRTTSRTLVFSVSAIVVKVPSIRCTRKKSCEKSGDLVYRMQRVVCSVDIHSSHVSRSGEVIEKASLPGEG